MKRQQAIALIRALVLPALLYAAMCTPGQAAERIIDGTVFYERGEPARDAGVQLRNVATLQVVSALSDKNGNYHFAGLNPDLDYEVSATKNGYRSPKHTVSRYSSKPVEVVNLYLKAEK